MLAKPKIKSEKWQPKEASGLKISNKNDAQEKEADAVADKVMLMPDRDSSAMPLTHNPQNKLNLSNQDPTDTLSLQSTEPDKDESLQLMPDIQPDIMTGNPEDSEEDITLATQAENPAIAEGIQTKDEDEQLSLKEEEENLVNLNEEEKETIQQKEEEEVSTQTNEEDSLQAKSDEEEGTLQTETEEDDSALQAKIDLKEEDEINAQSEEEQEEGPEEESVQPKRIDRKDNGSSRFASKDIESSLNRTKGQGGSLPDHAQTDLGSKMGADFSQIRIHTDGTANEMNKELGAKAFTHGSDIYFKSGEYNPGSSQGKRLIAHELTHTVQQGAASKVQHIEDANTANTVAREQESSFNRQEQAVLTPSQNTGNQSALDVPVQSREPQTSNLTGTENSKMESDVSQSKDLAKKTEETQKSEDKKLESINTEDQEKKEGQKKEEEGKESERMTDMVAPEMDGGAERLTKENEENKGAISKDLTKKSAKKAWSGVSKIGGLAANEQKKEDVGTKMQQIDEAVEEKPADKEAEVQSNQVSQVDALKAPETKSDLPKQELKEEMEDALPETLEDVDEFKSRGKGVYIGNQVSKIVEGETSKVESTYQKIEDTKEPEKPKESIPVGDVESPVETGNLNVGKGLVPEVEEEVTDLSEYSNESDKLLEREGIPEENLEMVDSGDLAEAKEERKSIKEKSEKSPKEVKEFEKKELKGVEKDLQVQESVNKKTMRNQREKGLQGAREEQKKTKSKIEKEREKVTKKINGIYEKANKDVKQKLADLETKSLAEFDKVQSRASKAFENNVNNRINKFKKKRYSGRFGFLKRGKDWLMGIDDFPEVKEIFNSEKKAFITTIDKAITKIIDNSHKVIKDCKDIIVKAKKDIGEYVKSLGPALQKTGEQAQKDIKEKLDKLDKDVDKAAARLKEKLQEKRAAAIKEIEKKIEKMKEEMSGALSKLGKLLLDAALKFFKWALEKAGYSAKQIMGIINKGKAVITKIVTDPKGFFKNLGKGIGQGFNNFVKNIKKHLIKGLIDWLTGAMGDTGLVLPKTWNLKGIFSLFLQIMGLSYNFLRSRLVKYVGEPVVAAAEGTFEMIKNIRKEGPIALWNWIKEKAAEIKQTIFEGIRNWVIVQVVKKAIIKLVSMLNPVGAIVQAILTIYDVVMFFVDNWDRIVATVKTIFSTISDIAHGRVGIVAKKVEQIMAMTIPMIISFLARFLGLSGLAKVIQNLIKKVRQPVVNIVDKAAKWIAKKIKKIKKKVKEKGAKIKKKIIGWWKARKSFKAKDGENHKIYFKGKGSAAVLMIASTPQSFESFIHSVEAKNKKAVTAKEKAMPIAKEIDKRKRDSTKGANDAETKKKEEKKRKDIDSLLDKLSIYAKDLFGVSDQELPESDIDFKFITKDSATLGDKMVAKVLTKKGPEGSTPTQARHSIFDKLKKRKEGGRSYYIRGHLLNHHVHGPGEWKNMTPLSQMGNKYHLIEAEKAVKAAVKSGAIVKYEVKAKYGKNVGVPTDDELKNKGIDNTKWQDLKEIREAENHVPEGLTLSAWILEKDTKQEGKYKIKQNLVSSKTVINPVDTNIQSYEVGAGTKKKERVILTHDNVDKIAENTGMSTSDLKVIQDIATNIPNLFNYSQIVDQIQKQEITDSKKVRLSNLVSSLQKQKNVVLK